MPLKSGERHFESLMSILMAQYDDLEGLLKLAREETAAAEKSDFDGILDLIERRATIGERLEIYHRQRAELRERLGDGAKEAANRPVAANTTSLISAIKVQDELSRPLLLNARSEALSGSLQASQAKRNLDAYAAKGKKPVAFDKRV